MKKRYIKNNKIYLAPIIISKEVEYTEKIKDENGVETEVKKTKKVNQYTNDEKTILAAGYKVYEPPKATLESLIDNSNGRINAITNRKILNEFVYNGYEFYLTSENQTNFANMYIARDFLDYPQKVKTKDGFMDLADASEVTNFYLAGVQFIKQCLEDGWRQKAEAEAIIRKNFNKRKLSYII
jgi:hypothetical protein